MASENKEEPKLLPHHEQQELCTTRLPYRQGRKLTAVKVYTINNESKHLLIFGVPSLNLRRETKELFLKFGKLLQFNLTNHASEHFTETYHALYDSIQSARLAKRMLDTKNYYGGNLHICYAPEFESIAEAKEKILLRKTQVIGRLRNLQKEADLDKQTANNELKDKLNDVLDFNTEKVEKMYMGSSNTIMFGKRKLNVNSKKSKLKRKDINFEINNDKKETVSHRPKTNTIDKPDTCKIKMSSNIEIIDFTSTETEVISNINEALNYKNFGQVVIKKIPYKPINRIKFNIINNNLK